jgi:hypothetical protein
LSLAANNKNASGIGMPPASDVQFCFGAGPLVSPGEPSAPLLVPGVVGCLTVLFVPFVRLGFFDFGLALVEVAAFV